MAFFKPKPGLPDNDKARIEFHLYQLAQCLGFERFQLPVQDLHTLVNSGSNVESLLFRTGAHLGHEVDQVTLETVPQELEKCGGGG